MVNLTTAENALKTVYLGAITDILNTQTNPLLAAIKHTSEGVFGKEIKRAVRAGLNGGIGAGTEDGDLPEADSSKYVQFTTTLKNLYGQIEISDKAIRASASHEGAFVDLLNAETESLLQAAKFNFGRMLFSDGSGLIDKCIVETPVRCYVENVGRFAPGMVVDLYYEGEKKATRTVSSVNYNTFVMYFDAEIDMSVDHYDLYVRGSKDKEITGLGHIFDTKSEFLYGAKRGSSSFLNPYIQSNVGEINESIIQKALDIIEMKSGTTPNFIVCSPGVRRSFIEYMSSFKRNVDVMDLAGGFKAVSYNGIPIVADRFVEQGAMYLLNTNDFKLHELCDWSWLENENGKILRQTQGKPTYTATLVKYADLICERPNAQGKLFGINER